MRAILIALVALCGLLAQPAAAREVSARSTVQMLQHVTENERAKTADLARAARDLDRYIQISDRQTDAAVVRYAQLSGGIGGFPGPGAAGGGAVGLTYIGSVTPTISNPTATVTGTSIGTPAADRHLVVVIDNNFSNIVTASVTVDSGGGAIAMTQRTFIGQNGGTTGIYSLTVPTGSTATIVGTVTGSGWASTRFHIYTITGLVSTTPTGANSSGATAASVSTTVATTSGGYIIAATNTQSASISNFTGSTETFIIDNGSGTTHVAAHAVNVATNASSTVNVNAAASASIAVSAAAWK